MIFGDDVTAARDTVAAAWIAPARDRALGTVGSLVPNLFSSVVKVQAPPPLPGDWWSAYRDLYRVVAEIGARHTRRADRAWFAVWEGHGFDSATSHVAWPQAPIDDPERRARQAHRARLRHDDVRRNTSIRNALHRLPRFALPDRCYYLLQGPVSAVVGLRDPSTQHWRNPDLFWPDDRRWFVATDVDFWSLYVGGDDDFVDELRRSVATGTEVVSLTDRLVIEV